MLVTLVGQRTIWRPARQRPTMAGDYARLFIRAALDTTSDYVRRQLFTAMRSVLCA